MFLKCNSFEKAAPISLTLFSLYIQSFDHISYIEIATAAMVSLVYILASWASIVSFAAAQTPSTVPTTYTHEPTPIYFYDPPTSYMYHFKPKKHEQSLLSYFGPAVGVGLVFTFVFIRYWRKHFMIGNDDEEGLFLDENDDDDFDSDDEEAIYDDVLSPTRRNIPDGGEIALNCLHGGNDEVHVNAYDLPNADDEDAVTNNVEHAIQYQHNHREISTNSSKHMIPMVLDDSDHLNIDTGQSY